MSIKNEPLWAFAEDFELKSVLRDFDSLGLRTQLGQWHVALEAVTQQDADRMMDGEICLSESEDRAGR